MEETKLYVSIIIDTDRLKKHYENPSKNKNHPTPIPHGDVRYDSTNYTYMVVSDKDGQHPQKEGTGNLEFTAKLGDIVRFVAKSESHNFENPVLIYGIEPLSGSSSVFSEFRNITESGDTVIPSGDEDDVLPAQSHSEDFYFYEANVERKGTEQYLVKFAMYETKTTNVIGYYSWDPTIIVN